MINKLIILAAGKGTRLRPVTNEVPKCLTPVGGRTILEWQINTAKRVGIKEIVVVGGYKYEKIDTSDIKLILNDSYNTSNMVESLKCAEKEFEGGFILSYGDILYEDHVLEEMMGFQDCITIASDMDWEKYWSMRFKDPLMDAEKFKFAKDNYVAQVGGKAQALNEIDSQYIGLLSFPKNGVSVLNDWFSSSYSDVNIYMTDMLTDMINSGELVKAHRIYRDWLEIDNLKDLAIAERSIEITKSGSLKIIS